MRPSTHKENRESDDAETLGEPLRFFIPRLLNVDVFLFFLFFLTIICSRYPACSPDSLCKALGKYRCVEKDTDLLLSTLSAMQEKAQHLECNLSAETRIKLDLFSALGDTRRQLEIAQGSSLSLLGTHFISLCRSETGQTRR